MIKPQFFESITEIEMRVHSAEQKIQSNKNAECLVLKLSLITIARGSCSMIISPGPPKKGYLAKLHIPRDRNVIEAAITVPQEHFDKLTNRMSQIVDRTVTAKMTLDKTLVLDNQGCLIIDDSTDALITDLVWTFSLK
jgi:hypothetical protein